MQISSNYQLNFKSGYIDKNARKVLSDRLPSGQFDIFIQKFTSKHKGNDYSIKLGTGVTMNNGLDACITYDKENFRYMEEGLFSSIFSHPVSFMKKINKQIIEDLKSIGLKGHIS